MHQLSAVISKMEPFEIEEVSSVSGYVATDQIGIAKGNI